MRTKDAPPRDEEVLQASTGCLVERRNVGLQGDEYERISEESALLSVAFQQDMALSRHNPTVKARSIKSFHLFKWGIECTRYV